MFLSKAVRAATLAVAGAFLLSTLPALAVPVLPPLKPTGFAQAGITEVATNTADKSKKKKKPAKKTAAKKKPPAKKKPAKTA